MKIATRIALLQRQANPADPANLMRLVVAWVTPGMRESTGPNGPANRLKPDRPLKSAPHGFSGCEIERWAAKAGFVGSQLSQASGIPLDELQAGKCVSAQPSQEAQPAKR